MPSAQLLLRGFERERLRRLVVEHLSALHGLGAVGHGLHELGYLLVLLGELPEQRQSNERIAREMRGMVSEMKDVLEKVEELRNGAADAQHQANQMALMGVANAQQKAGEMTIKNVEEVTARSRKVIDSMVDESKKRIERLSMVTLPDRLFYYSKWMAVILVLIILVHVLWGMLV